MTGLNAGDADSDISYLVGPPEIHQMLDTHAPVVEERCALS